MPATHNHRTQNIVINRRMLCARLCAALIALCVLGGCTKEKALALKAAADIFRDRAIAAIENYETLMVIGAYGPSQPEAQQFQQILEQLRARYADGPLRSSEVQTALLAIDEHERNLALVRARFDELRTAYIAYAASLSRLPEGSFFSGDAVACATGLGVRLTQRMMVFAQASRDSPVRYQYRLAKGIGELNRALSTRNDAEAQRAVGELIETRKAEIRDNAAALSKFVVAVDSGVRTVSLARAYGQMSTQDVLGGLTELIEIRASILGTDATKTVAQLDALRAQMEQDPALKPLLTLPLSEPVPACSHSTTGG